ncbi:phage integrase N-terminal SAM-like domain-containing protein [Synechococcus sp. Lug-A]|uniref:phage integrase N-terminal SAM-like domain-containing protein n=1 Tax=Synechococcus sp. Lug-A TaxID=2823740 RepID=UPI0020CC4A7D|nr:phage integrase N-terminal SAM-like domain-containing protein [Synechococcus sp. Lug-A]
MTGSRPAGLIQRYREELQVRHYARRTVNTYEQWLRRFLRFHGLRHPREMGSSEVNAFLAHLAVERKVSASTQNQALAALLFLYPVTFRKDVTPRLIFNRPEPMVLAELSSALLAAC